MTTKQALDKSMSNAAAHTNRLRALLALSKQMPADLFMFHAGQHPDTLERDLHCAEQDYQQAKSDYESHCRELGVPAYSTYNED